MQRLAKTASFLLLWATAHFYTVPAMAADTPPPKKAEGSVSIHLTNVLGKALNGRINLVDLETGSNSGIEVKDGRGEGALPQGTYRAYANVYCEGVPVMVDVQDLTVTAGQSTPMSVNLLEGSSGALTVRDFDADGDLAIDRVELASGTDPYNAAELPGKPTLQADTRVLGKEAGWYSGELHAHSLYGGGKESVRHVIKRATRAGLDFLAITDRNTMEATRDPDFRSNKIVLIPALEWGTDEKGVALVYGPRTMLDPPSTFEMAQGACVRVQAQGGIFAIAHPCLPTAPWQWGLSFVNAVEIWYRGWREVPPFTLDQLGEDLKVRKDGRPDEKLIYSVAQAAARADLAQVSSNAQAAYFYDLELNRGLMACALAGSNTSSPKAKIGLPLTRVYARDKSMPAILEGIRMGRTYVTSGPDGPTINFTADVLDDKKIDVGIGGVIPLDVDTRFLVAVRNAKGKKLEVMENGRAIRTVPIVKNSIAISFVRHPKQYGVYRVRVIGPPKSSKKGLGDIDVYAATSPIYAQEITQELLWRNKNLDTSKTWVRLESDKNPEPALPEDMPPAIAAP